jgi:hypothetical protein
LSITVRSGFCGSDFLREHRPFIYFESFIASGNIGMMECFSGQSGNVTDKEKKKFADADFACPQARTIGELRSLN